MRVAGACFKHKHLKKYILWALKMLEDMPAIFPKAEYLSQYDNYDSKKTYQQAPFYDFYLVDDA